MKNVIEILSKFGSTLRIAQNFDTVLNQFILSVIEKLPVSKFRYFGKYIIQIYGYFYVYVSGQQRTGFES